MIRISPAVKAAAVKVGRQDATISALGAVEFNTALARIVAAA
jgi:hypothetical protein